MGYYIIKRHQQGVHTKPINSLITLCEGEITSSCQGKEVQLKLVGLLLSQNVLFREFRKLWSHSRIYKKHSEVETSSGLLSGCPAPLHNSQDLSTPLKAWHFWEENVSGWYSFIMQSRLVVFSQVTFASSAHYLLKRHTPTSCVVAIETLEQAT